MNFGAEFGRSLFDALGEHLAGACLDLLHRALELRDALPHFFLELPGRLFKHQLIQRHERECGIVGSTRIEFRAATSAINRLVSSTSLTSN